MLTMIINRKQVCWLFLFFLHAFLHCLSCFALNMYYLCNKKSLKPISSNKNNSWKVQHLQPVQVNITTSSHLGDCQN